MTRIRPHNSFILPLATGLAAALVWIGSDATAYALSPESMVAISSEPTLATSIVDSLQPQGLPPSNGNGTGGTESAGTRGRG